MAERSFIQHTAWTCPGRPCSYECDHRERIDVETPVEAIVMDDRTARVVVPGMGEVLVLRTDDPELGPGVRIVIDIPEEVPVEVDR